MSMNKPKNYSATYVTQHNSVSLLNTLKCAVVSFSIVYWTWYNTVCHTGS